MHPREDPEVTFAPATKTTLGVASSDTLSEDRAVKRRMGYALGASRAKGMRHVLERLPAFIGLCSAFFTTRRKELQTA